MKYKFYLFIVFWLVLAFSISASEHASFKITILYDNYVIHPETQAEWGFACLIEGGEKTILFDTGNSPEILKNNIRVIGIDVNKIDQIVLSHNHQDHTGGLMAVLAEKSDVSVYLPDSFPMLFERKVQRAGANVVNVKESVEICKNIFSTGELGQTIPEQALVLNLPRGLVVVTGCAHPGIVNIAKKAKSLFRKELYLVIGGFHLLRKSNAELQQIINDLKQLGVKNVAPTHCTGDAAITAFKKAFREDFIQAGTGKIFNLAENIDRMK